ncbi:Uncharacterized protein TCM_009974 [Theobroma cacao]|uniref:Uncharacterized protein n=1 Tax=Theobroma cacao TaxID=3641 RepID=A0A061E7A3_THECC|nr:Uncharacterized protein TCM_009974 [Theobroma cacao]
MILDSKACSGLVGLLAKLVHLSWTPELGFDKIGTRVPRFQSVLGLFMCVNEVRISEKFGSWGVLCNYCSNVHGGPCHRATRLCFGCGQFEHLMRDYPMQKQTIEGDHRYVRQMATTPPKIAQIGRNVRSDKGKGIASLPRNRLAQPSCESQVHGFTPTPQDAQTSNAMVTSTPLICGTEALVLYLILDRHIPS